MTIVLSFWRSEIFEVALISSFMLPLFDICTYRVISSVKPLRKARNQINFCELVIFGYTRFTEVLVLFHFVLKTKGHLLVVFHKDTRILCITCIQKSKSLSPAFDYL